MFFSAIGYLYSLADSPPVSTQKAQNEKEPAKTNPPRLRGMESKFTRGIGQNRLGCHQCTQMHAAHRLTTDSEGQMNDPAKLISIMKVMLSELERSLSGASQPVDEDIDAATSNLKSRIDRLEAVLKKREDHLHRQKALEKQNRENTRRR